MRTLQHSAPAALCSCVVTLAYNVAALARTFAANSCTLNNSFCAAVTAGLLPTSALMDPANTMHELCNNTVQDLLTCFLSLCATAAVAAVAWQRPNNVHLLATAEIADAAGDPTGHAQSAAAGAPAALRANVI